MVFAILLAPRPEAKAEAENLWLLFFLIGISSMKVPRLVSAFMQRIVHIHDQLTAYEVLVLILR